MADTQPKTQYAPTVYKPTAADMKLKMLVYGPPGAGKTTLAVSAQDCTLTAPVLMCNIEGGLLSVANKDFDVVDYENMEQLENLLWFLVREKHKYKTFILDSLSELQVYNLEAIVQKEIRTNPKRTSGSRDDIWQDDYGVSTSQIRRIVRAFRDMPMHVFLTCHDAETVKNNDRSVHPALTQKLRQSVVGYMDLVGYLMAREEKIDEKSTVVRRMLCQPVGPYIAKDRTPGGKMGTILENPSVSLIMERLGAKGNVNGE